MPRKGVVPRKPVKLVSRQSQVSMPREGVITREPVKLVSSKCRCPKRASSQRTQGASRCLPSVDAQRGHCPKESCKVGQSQVSMTREGVVPREPVKLDDPKCRCPKRASLQGIQGASWCAPSVEARKSVLPREPVKLVSPKCPCLTKASSQGTQISSWFLPSVDAQKGHHAKVPR